jgi:ribonucleoside-diphosphate reductase alpha chain
LIYAYKLGLKTLYYQNTNDGSGEVELKDEKQYNTEQQSLSDSDDGSEDCDSCKL